MSNDFSNFSFLPGSTLVPGDLLEDAVFPGAGVAVTENGNGGVWIDRIVCYGKTQEEAQALRDRVLYGLQLVAQEEHEQEMSLRATAQMVAEGKIAVCVHVGGKVLGAGLGSKDDD